jgi:hypothetical protein
MKLKTAKDIRTETFALLKKRGFQPADSLPLPDAKQTLRPVVEIAARLMALDNLFKWVAFPEAEASSKEVRQQLEANQLQVWLTKDENAIASLPRTEARKAHVETIGWKLENMWPLAWVLGHEPEPTIDTTLTDYPMIEDFLLDLDATVDDLVRKSSLRTIQEVIPLEYRFYCTHNAVRSAQIGGETVPEEFHPILHGGAIHERRHALTWCLSPGVPWDDTDLST